MGVCTFFNMRQTLKGQRHELMLLRVQPSTAIVHYHFLAVPAEARPIRLRVAAQ